MRKSVRIVAALSATALLAGCAMDPRGPSVRAFPPPYKPFRGVSRRSEHVRGICAQPNRGRRGSGEQSGGRLRRNWNGAWLGLGRRNRQWPVLPALARPAVPAVGSTIGANQSERANFSLQRRYDIAYAQCMYAKGNQVPGFRGGEGAASHPRQRDPMVLLLRPEILYGRPPPPPPRGG